MANPLTYTIPTIGQPNSSECVKVDTALTQIQNWGNNSFGIGTGSFVGDNASYISVTQNHGMSVTPLFVAVTPTSSTYPGASAWGGNVSVINITSTSFEVTFNLVSGSFASSATYSFMFFCYAG